MASLQIGRQAFFSTLSAGFLRYRVEEAVHNKYYPPGDKVALEEQLEKNQQNCTTEKALPTN